MLWGTGQSTIIPLYYARSPRHPFNPPMQFAAFLIAQYHATPLPHTCQQVRLRARVWLVPGELQKAQLPLIRARAALRVSSGEPRRGGTCAERQQLNKRISDYRLDGCSLVRPR
jgi:hypothetical protein